VFRARMEGKNEVVLIPEQRKNALAAAATFPRKGKNARRSVKG